MAGAKSLSILGVLGTERRDFYLDPQTVAELYPDVSPFLSDLMSRPGKATKDPDYKLFEHRSGFLNQKFVINGSVSSNWSTGAAGDTATIPGIDGIVGLDSSASTAYVGLTFDVYASDDTTYKGQIIITANSGAALTAKSLGNPQLATNLCAALADNDICYGLSSAFGEGTEAPEATDDELSVVYNSTQIFKTSVEVTGTLMEAALRGYSDEFARLQLEKLKEHKNRISKQFLHGTRPYGIGSTDLAGDTNSTDAFGTAITDANGKTVRMTMGLIPAIQKYGASSGTSQNIFNVTANNYSYANFVDDSEKVFQYLPESGVKRAACGGGALSFWSKLSGGEGFMKNTKWKVNLSDMKQSKLGFSIRELETPHGLIQLYHEPALRGKHANKMVVYDPSNVGRRVYRNAKYSQNIKTDNGYDGIKNEYRNDEGLDITLIESHSLWTIN